MSAEFNRDEHLAEIFDAAVRLAPMCTNGIDFSNDGRFQHGGKSDVERVADRAWEAGQAFVAKYHAEVEAAGVRFANEEKRAGAEPKRPKREAVHG
jgi:hypothetical protein